MRFIILINILPSCAFYLGKIAGSLRLAFDWTKKTIGFGYEFKYYILL